MSVSNKDNDFFQSKRDNFVDCEHYLEGTCK